MTSVLRTTAETAERLGTTPGTLEVWRCLRRYPLNFVKIGRKVFYKETDIEAFIASRTVAGDGNKSRSPQSPRPRRRRLRS
jgi:hypothetical protein